MEITSINLSVKPTLTCNGRCIYCHALRPGPDMSTELLSELFSKLSIFAKRHRLRHIAITWHGGEPMLMGAGFFRSVKELQERWLGEIPVRHTMQSNACLYQGDMRDVLQDLLHTRTIGTCLDPFHPTRRLAHEDIHASVHLENTASKNPEGRPLPNYFQESLNGCIRLLNDGFHVGMIYVAHKQSLDVVRELYYFFKNLNTASLLVHPVEDFPDPEFSMSAADWGEFLKRLWDVWQEDNYRYRVFPLQEWRDFLTVGKPLQSCQYGPLSPERVHLTVSPEGDLFPCHRFVEKNICCLGNIRDMTFEEIVTHEYSRVLRDKKDHAPLECLECPFFRVCRSGCVATHDQSGKTRLCAGLKDFFAYVKAHRSGEQGC
jgi:uncharacterized protein